MGFKRLVDASVNSQGERDGILYSLREINEAVNDRSLFHVDDQDARLQNFEVRSFSDLIVRFRPLGEDGDQEFAVFREVLDLCFAQSRLLQRGILVRGGMTIGPLYYDELHVFGPGLVRAYELESHLAVYPRIITEFSLGQNFTKYRIKEGGYPYVEADSDGIPFLSYISPNTSYFAKEINSSALRQIHAAIELNLRETQSIVASDRQKLLWVCGKFNKLIEQLASDTNADREWLNGLHINPELHGNDLA
jgi:hypothetical protein